MKNIKPLVTIVTVTFNAQDTIEKTIINVINQDYPFIEYIIIDGESTDNTLNIIKKYQNRISLLLCEHDKGIYDAMNKAIDLAQGDWINFMNAGDTFSDLSTISQVTQHFDNAHDLLVGDINYIHDNDKQYKAAKSIKYALNTMFCCHQAVFTRTELMKKYKFCLEYHVASDYDFLLKCLFNQHQFKFLHFAVSNYISGGQTESNSLRNHLEQAFIQSKYSNKIQSLPVPFDLLQGYKPYNKLTAMLINSLYSECEHLKLNKRKFILYGFGHIGQFIHQHYSFNISHIVDINFEHLNQTQAIEIKPVNFLQDLNVDYIVISALGRELEISEQLINQYHISKEKILTFSL